MRQRAALLRTYLSSNGVALLDEPFSALDTITKAVIHKWYLDVMQSIDLSTVFITHDIDEAILLSDRIYILADGVCSNEIKIDCPKPRVKDMKLANCIQYTILYSNHDDLTPSHSYALKLKSLEIAFGDGIVLLFTPFTVT